MKKIIKKLAATTLIIALAGCGASGPKAVETYDPGMGNGVVKSYTEMDNGTWESGGETYTKCITLTGKTEGSDRETTYTVLTNDENITFEQAAESMSDNGSPLVGAVIVEISNQ